MIPKAPDYHLMLRDKADTKSQTRAGAAWIDQYGRIRIKLNPCIAIDWKDEVYLLLLPNVEYQDRPGTRGARLDADPGPAPEDAIE